MRSSISFVERAPGARSGRLSTLLLLTPLLIAVSAAASHAKTSPYSKPDDTWISISGKVKSIEPDSFMLDYGKGVITVEMDDGDRDADAYKLLAGDKVTVHGLIDDDLYESSKIEASSVFVEKLGTYFYASSVDEEDYYFSTLPLVIDTGASVLRGEVTSVGGDEFTLNSGDRSLVVDVEDMSYDPLDGEGYQKIETGDVVRVAGHLREDFFDGRVFEAQSIVTLIH